MTSDSYFHLGKSFQYLSDQSSIVTRSLELVREKASDQIDLITSAFSWFSPMNALISLFSNRNLFVFYLSFIPWIGVLWVSGRYRLLPFAFVYCFSIFVELWWVGTDLRSQSTLYAKALKAVIFCIFMHMSFFGFEQVTLHTIDRRLQNIELLQRKNVQ